MGVGYDEVVCGNVIGVEIETEGTGADSGPEVKFFGLIMSCSSLPLFAELLAIVLWPIDSPKTFWMPFKKYSTTAFRNTIMSIHFPSSSKSRRRAMIGTLVWTRE